MTMDAGGDRGGPRELAIAPDSSCALLRPGQIVYLDCRQTRLYAEVVQIVEARQMGWIRPLAMVLESGAVQVFPRPHSPDDRAAPDVLWPLAQIQAALDTDILPILARLTAKEPESSDAAIADDQPSVNDFVQWLWVDS